ncbi:MAG: hypothetical protein FWF46_02785 [Oscillospiraceae bacterium]|nr:hypothetical protein [Oscillospiraceae bacterium]
MGTMTMVIIALGAVVALIVLLGVVYFVMSSREAKKKTQEELENTGPMITRDINSVPIESTTNFMDFDEVKDNMIIRKKRTQYIMVIQCQGVNYDLLSGEEKMAVEEGFIQFLNTLRFPIQLYVQTRTLNLKDIVDEYKSRMQGMKDEIEKIKIRLDQAKRTGNLDAIDKLEFDIRRKENVLSYGTDISDYISRLSVNRNILQQKTYVIASYFVAEAGDMVHSANEDIDSICFSELYTRCQSIISALASAEVMGRVLNSEELAELLYIAYNRDDSENLQLSKVLNAQYDALYSSGKDILLKKQEKLKQDIEAESIELATQSILEADRKRQEEIELRRIQVQEKAEKLIDEYQAQMDPALYEAAKKEVRNRKIIKKTG